MFTAHFISLSDQKLLFDELNHLHYYFKIADNTSTKTYQVSPSTTFSHNFY